MLVNVSFTQGYALHLRQGYGGSLTLGYYSVALTARFKGYKNLSTHRESPDAVNRV